MEDKPDDLDITSIGVLYRGPWDKKYWSCSRGKDRYPYPVGYHAVRTHAGSTYRMEIHEGLKGPVFVVTSIDGDSCTGQTPDIAWENFQKKSGPRVRNWHGKRFSSKIDGVELFGFKNPFVQRLLRELVANVNGIAERSLLFSNFRNAALQLNSEMRIQDSHAYPDLLPYLGKQQSTRKRTMKNKGSTKSLRKEAMVKRIRYEDLLNNADGDSSEQVAGPYLHAKDASKVHIQEHMSSKDGSLTTNVATYILNNSSKGSVAALNSETPCQADPEYQNDAKSIGVITSIKNISGYEDLGTLSLQVNLSNAVENCHPFLESEHKDGFVEKHVISHEQSKVLDCENSCMEYRLSHVDKVLLGRLSDAELDQGDSSVAPNDRVGQIPALTSHSNDFVPDTYDTARDAAARFALESNKGSPCSMKNELIAVEPMFRASASCAWEIIPKSMPNEFISKSKDCSSEGMHPVPPETCTPLDPLSKILIKDSLQEVGSSSGSPNLGSERIDLEIVGQELAKSMMTFLLPRAVPLLKKTYVKRRSKHRKRETKCDPSSNLGEANSAELNVRNDDLTVYTTQDKPVAGTLAQESEERDSEEMINPQRMPDVVSLSEVTKVELPVSNCMINEPLNAKDVKSIIPDSLEEGQNLCDVAIQSPLPSGFDEADAALGDEIKCNNVTRKLPVNDTEGHMDSSCCPFENDGCSRGFIRLEEPEKGEIFSSDSLAACLHPHKSIPLEEKSNDECVNVDDKSSCHNNDVIPSLHPSCVMPDSSLHFNADCIYNADEEMLQFEDMPLNNPLRSQKAEHSEQDPPDPSSNCKLLGDNEVGKATLIQHYTINSSPDKTLRSSRLNDLVDFDVDAVDPAANGRNQEGAVLISQVGIDGKAVGVGKGSLFCMPDAVSSSSVLPSDSFKAGNLPCSPLSFGKYIIPLSESIICRNLNDNNGSDVCSAPKTSYIVENGHARHKGSDAIIKMPVANEVKIDKKLLVLDAVENVTISDSTLFTVASCVFEKEDLVKNSAANDTFLPCFKENGVSAASGLHIPLDWRKDFCDPSRNGVLEALSCSDKSIHMMSPVNNDCTNLSFDQIYQKNHLDGSLTKEKHSNEESGGTLELVGCYMHPHPVLCIWLSSKEDYLHISVLCGPLDGEDRNLFLYMVPIKEQRGSCPSFIGYTSLVLPILKGPCKEYMSFEKYGLQFTPDGLSLVFLNSIKAPHCREQNISCLCSTCKSNCGEKTAIEVAYVKFGYVSPVAKLTTIEGVSCILVCEPNFLIAAEECGRLHVWKMTHKWSESLEEFMLPNFDYISPAISELKKIPKCYSLIIGHNGTGGFGLWDISKRVLLARFYSPGNAIFQIVPISLFSWKDKGTVASCQDHRKGSMLTANEWLPKAGENPIVLASGEDIAVWLLISAASDTETRHDKVKQPNRSTVRLWRLALLAKNMVITGSMLDPRASAVGVSSDYGIIGTCDGLLYKWEFSTGKKLADLHYFKCGVSQVAVDAKSGAVAVAGDEEHLLVYVQS